MMTLRRLKPAEWVNEMLASGAKTFYKKENGKRLYYDIPSKSYKTMVRLKSFII
ncbi:MAG: hypothetical protein U5N85_13955 [Arcicella sp.]|nr:hypothetical protein [Arcicella sp.]